MNPFLAVFTLLSLPLNHQTAPPSLPPSLPCITGIWNVIPHSCCRTCFSRMNLHGLFVSLYLHNWIVCADFQPNSLKMTSVGELKATFSSSDWHVEEPCYCIRPLPPQVNLSASSLVCLCSSWRRVNSKLSVLHLAALCMLGGNYEVKSVQKTEKESVHGRLFMWR